MLSVLKGEQFHKGTNHLIQEKKTKKNEMEQLHLIHSLQGEGLPSVNIGKSENKQISRHACTLSCMNIQSDVLHLCDGIGARTRCEPECTLLGRHPVLWPQWRTFSVPPSWLPKPVLLYDRIGIRWLHGSAWLWVRELSLVWHFTSH